MLHRLPGRLSKRVRLCANKSYGALFIRVTYAMLLRSQISVMVIGLN